jgi:hypothetical protein
MMTKTYHILIYVFIVIDVVESKLQKMLEAAYEKFDIRVRVHF